MNLDCLRKRMMLIRWLTKLELGELRLKGVSDGMLWSGWLKVF